MRTNFWAGISLTGLAVLAVGAILTVKPNVSQAHCQVPCGIYDDGARIARLREDTATIAKAITNIKKLADSHDAQGVNQLIRWTNTKEHHASHIIEIVSQYFLTQKVKTKAPGADGYDAYLKSLADHHAVMVAAMKTKQNANDEVVKGLTTAIDALAKHYE